MERERKGRARPERGMRAFFTTLGLVRVSKAGEVRVAWRDIGIAVGLVALLTLLLLPRMRLPTRPLAVGDVAPAAIKAHANFLIEDEGSTQKKRREAEEGVLPVYDFDMKPLEAMDRRLQLALQVIETAFQVRAPELLGTLTEGRVAPLAPEETARTNGLGGAEATMNRDVIMASAFFQAREQEFQRVLGVDLHPDTMASLRQLKYDPRLRDGIMQAASSVMRRGIVSDKESFADHRERGMILRDLRSGQERVVSDTTSILELRKAAESVMAAALAPNTGYPAALQQVIAAIAPKLLQPNVTFNTQETEERERRAVDAVKPVFYQVKRGEMIIREGERVREEHIPRLKALLSGKHQGHLASSVVGTTFFVALVVIFGLLCLRQVKPKFAWDQQDLLLLAVLLLGNLLATRAFMVVAHALVETFPFVEPGAFLYALPITIGGILVAMFFDFQVGIVFSVMTSLLIGVLLRDSLVMPVLALVGNLVATFRVKQYTQRSSILVSGLLIGLANVFTLLAFGLMSSNLFSWSRAYEAVFGLLGGLLAAVVGSAVLPLLESLFKLTTDIKLLELASLNHPLMRQLVMHAPGTYQHSMLVGTLAEAAAEAVGANALLARVGSYYHDIGKMLTPEYFVENQLGRGNKHDRLSPSMSALIIMAHVKDGIKLAKEYKLPQRIIDIIPQHHGTNLITYFYNKAKELEDPHVQQVHEGDYRYPGPKPQTREAAIVMLADKVEAACRVLTEPTPQRIKGLVQRIVNNIFMDGQLDECDLTLRDLQKISDAFTRTLIAIHHHRIEYPAVESEEVKRRTRSTDGHQLSESTKEDSDRHAESQKDPAAIARSPRMSDL